MDENAWDLVEDPKEKCESQNVEVFLYKKNI